MGMDRAKLGGRPGVGANLLHPPPSREFAERIRRIWSRDVFFMPSYPTRDQRFVLLTVISCSIALILLNIHIACAFSKKENKNVRIMLNRPLDAI